MSFETICEARNHIQLHGSIINFLVIRPKPPYNACLRPVDIFGTAVVIKMSLRAVITVEEEQRLPSRKLL